MKGARRWLAEVAVAWRAGLGALVAGGLLFAGVPLGCCAFSGPVHRGAPTENFNGRTFQNQDPIAHGGFFRFLRWQATAEPVPWDAVADAEPGPAPPKGVGRGALRVTFVGHATLLVQMDGLNVLTDPIWSERATPVEGVGPKRVRPPGLRFEDLPPIHAVLISHNHYDHLDLPTLKRLHEAHHPRFFVGLGNKALLEDAGITDVVALDWWRGEALADEVAVSAVPAQHFAQRGLCDADRTLWVGWVLRGPAGVVYFAGDTGFGPHFAQIRKRFGAPRLALLPIGAYLPRWFMKGVHIDPVEAVEAHRVLGATLSVGMHFGTFPLADEGRDQAPLDLRAAMAEAGVAADRFWVLGFGEGRDVPASAR